MKKYKYWNHNVAYYNWIKRKIKDRKNILDVGCGNGALIRFLNNGNNNLIGLDPSIDCVNIANNLNKNQNIKFLVSKFEEFEVKTNSFDTIVFVASLHHMEMDKAILKAKSLLKKNGILIIVGLANPSSFLDYLIELLRIIPSKIISYFKSEKTSEKLEIPTSYDLPKMSYVLKIINNLLPNYKFRYGLYYRYLLTWIKN